jgi:transcription elongation factor Elf1
MKIEEKLRNYNTWTCPNCNKKYKNPELEMELIVGVGKDNRLITSGDGIFKQEYRCNKCEAHLLVECKIKLDWQNAKIRRG